MTEAALQTLCKGTLDITDEMVTLFYEFKSYVTNIFILMQIEEDLCEYGDKNPSLSCMLLYSIRCSKLCVISTNLVYPHLSLSPSLISA